MFNHKRILRSLIGAASLLLVSQYSLAGHASKCLQYDPSAHFNEVVINYVNAKVGSFDECLTNGQFQLESAMPFFRENNRLLSRMTNLRNDLDRNLTQTAADLAREELPSFLKFKSSSVSITGPISIVLMGQPDSNGTLQLRVEGFGIYGIVRAEQSSLLKAKVTLRASNMSFAANYNVNTGRVTAVNPLSNYIDVDVDSSGLVFDLLPFLHVFSNQIENKFQDDFNNDIRRFLENGASSIDRTLFSLNEEIPDGVFVHPTNGIDFGARVKEQVSNFVEDVNVSITQSGKTLQDTYVNINLQNIRLTFGRKFYPHPFEHCLPFCNNP